MPLQFVKDNVNIDFIGKRRIGFLISALCIIASLAVMLAGSGLRMGIDFAGGVIAQVQFKDAIADGCGTDAPGSLVAWMCRHSLLHSMEMPGSRYDIGNLESYENVQRTYKGIVR